MRVLGIDPGTAVLGYGVVEGGPGRPARMIECGVVRTTAAEPLELRLRTVYEEVVALIARHQPDALAVEGVFTGRNVRSTVSLAQARGVILLAGAQAGVPVAEYSPALVKKTVVGRERRTNRR